MSRAVTLWPIPRNIPLLMNYKQEGKWNIDTCAKAVAISLTQQYQNLQIADYILNNCIIFYVNHMYALDWCFSPYGGTDRTNTNWFHTVQDIMRGM